MNYNLSVLTAVGLPEIEYDSDLGGHTVCKWSKADMKKKSGLVPENLIRVTRKAKKQI